MADDTTQRDIGRIEGRLEGIETNLLAIERLIREQNVASSESRKALYERVGAIETDIRISAGIDAQVRERLDSFEARLSDDVMPTINEYKKIKMMGSGILWAAGLAGGSLTAAAIYWWEALLNTLKGLLR